MQKVKIKSPEEIRDYIAEYSFTVPDTEFGEHLLKFAEEMDGNAYSEHVAIYIWKLCARYPYDAFNHNIDTAIRVLVSAPHATRTIEYEMGMLRRAQRVLLREELAKWVTQVFPLF